MRSEKERAMRDSFLLECITEASSLITASERQREPPPVYQAPEAARNSVLVLLSRKY